MPGYIQDGHVPGQLQRVAFKLSGVGMPGGGKTDIYLADRLALTALHAGNTHADEDRLGTDRHLSPGPLRPAVVNQLSTPAGRTGQGAGAGWTVKIICPCG